MLVLTRSPGQTIQIGSDITVTILEIQGKRMKIGIEAPQQQRVLRGELGGWEVGNGTRQSGRPVRRISQTTWLAMPDNDVALATVR